jgi:hypothetical protein
MSALARWDDLLTKIRDRHDQVRAEAEADARTFIAQVASGGDPLPLSHRLSAVTARLQDLESKITDTWHEKVDHAIGAEGHPVSARDAAFARGQRLRDALDDAREELEVRMLALLARERYAAATAAHRPVPCGRCGAAIAAPISFRALELACAACGAVAVWQPAELMVSVAAIGTHAVAQEAALGEWRAMRAAERAVHELRPPRPLAPLLVFERAQIAYWRTYLQARAWFEPELGRDPAREIAARMEPWYLHTAEHEAAWVAAGRPRAPL